MASISRQPYSGIIDYLKQLKQSKVAANAVFVLITQIVNFIFPFLTIKYLVSVLGSANFGKISFAQSFIGYFVVIVSYGFNTTATQAVALNREDERKTSRIFYSVLYAKGFLLGVCLAVLAVCLWVFPGFFSNPLLYLFYFGIVVGDMLFPQWYFLGIEKMGYITLISAVVKFVFLLLIFLVVKTSEDFLYVPILNSLSFVLPGVYGLYLARKKVGNFIAVSWADVRRSLKDGYSMFVSGLMSLVTSGSGILMLGALQSDTIVGYYAGFEKIARASTLIVVPITVAIYPKVSRKFLESKDSGYRYLKRMGIITIGAAVLVAIGIIVGSSLITRILYTDDFQRYRIILIILAIWAVASTLSTFIGVQYLTSVGKSRIYRSAFVCTAAISLPVLYLLTKYYSYIGTALSMLLNECLLISLMALFLFAGTKRRETRIRSGSSGSGAVVST